MIVSGQPVENSSDAVWTKSPSQPFFWMSRNVGKALRDIQTTATSETSVNPSRMLHLRDNAYHRAPAP